MGRAGPSVPRQGGAQARGLLAEPQERTEGWRPGRPRADGLGAALAGAAAGMGAQTKPRAVPSLLNHTRDRPERSVSRPSHASSPASQLLCPSPACHLSSAATISRPLGLFTNVCPRPPPPTPNPRPTHSLTSTCPSGPAHAACARLPASVGHVTCPSVPRGHPVHFYLAEACPDLTGLSLPPASPQLAPLPPAPVLSQVWEPPMGDRSDGLWGHHSSGL